MKAPLIDKHGNLEVLRGMRKSLIKEERLSEEFQRKIKQDEERWGTLKEVAENIGCACQDRDLGQLARSVKRMKNILRRPSVRKDLAQLENEGGKGVKKDKDEKPEGACSCAKCGKLIDGSADPCADGAFCVDCAMKKETPPPGQKEKKKAEKKAKKGTAFPPEMIGGGAGGKGQGGGAQGGEGEPPEKAAPEKEPPEEPEEPPVRGKKKKKQKDKRGKKKNKDIEVIKGKNKAESRLRHRDYSRILGYDDGEYGDKSWT